MSTASLDFIKQANPRTRRVWLLLGGALFVASVVHYQSLTTALHDAQSELDARSQQQSRTAKKPVQVAQNPTQQAAIKGLSMNWEPLFTSLEAAIKPGVALLAIEPDATKSSVRLNLEARDSEAMTDYVEALAAQPGLANVSLMAQETQLEHPQQPLRFSAGATWRQ